MKLYQRSNKNTIFTIVLTKDSWEVNAPYKLLPYKAQLESNLSPIALNLENAQLCINLFYYLAEEPCRGWVRRQINDICSVLSKASALRTLMISWPNTFNRNPPGWLRNALATGIVNGLPGLEVVRPLITHLLEPMGLLPKSVSYQMCSSPVREADDLVGVREMLRECLNKAVALRRWSGVNLQGDT